MLAVAAWLCVVNLDYAALWHDEAPAALIGRNLLEQGDIVGWDGRHLLGGTNARTLNGHLRDVLPPLTYVFNAAAFSVFGVNEIGARIVPALLGIASLALLHVLLRQHLGNHPRLVFFAFLFAAWSPQLLLFFRQSRYYAFMVFAAIAAFYLYERYWRTRRAMYLGALTLVATLAFFNHYSGGAATMLSVAAWHLALRARETARRQWVAFAGCAMLPVACGTAYLVWLGVVGGERSGFLAFSGVTGIDAYEGTTPLVLLRVGIYMRDLFAADWISWPVFLWFAGMLSLAALRNRRQAGTAGESRRTEDSQQCVASSLAGAPRRARASEQPGASSRAAASEQPGASSRAGASTRSRASNRAGTPGRGRREAHASPGPPGPPGDDLPLGPAAGIVLMGSLFALFSAALAVQPVWTNPFADLRYYVAALPLLLAMKGLFVEWTWRRSRIAGAAALAVLLFSSAGAAPFNMTNQFSGERTLGPHLFQLVREIHRPYRDSLRMVSDYLLEHAAQNDLVYVPDFANREALAFSVGHRVLLCCVLDDDTPLPRDRVEALGRWVRRPGTRPDWIVIFGWMHKPYRDRVKAAYAVAAQLDVHPYPTQRPEIDKHAFAPLDAEPAGVSILRLRPAPRRGAP